jgi:hypothetical protein
MREIRHCTDLVQGKKGQARSFSVEKIVLFVKSGFTGFPARCFPYFWDSVRPYIVNGALKNTSARDGELYPDGSFVRLHCCEPDSSRAARRAAKDFGRARTSSDKRCGTRLWHTETAGGALLVQA